MPTDKAVIYLSFGYHLEMGVLRICLPRCCQMSSGTDAKHCQYITVLNHVKTFFILFFNRDKIVVINFHKHSKHNRRATS